MSQTNCPCVTKLLIQIKPQVAPSHSQPEPTCSPSQSMVNAVSERTSFPLPRLEDVWDAIGDAKACYFTVLDMTSGFWQVPLHPETNPRGSLTIVLYYRSCELTGTSCLSVMVMLHTCSFTLFLNSMPLFMQT